MPTQTVVRPVTPVIGAEITGVDLGNVDEDTFQTILAALTEHGVLFFHDQDISVESQKAFGARFGELVDLSH